MVKVGSLINISLSVIMSVFHAYNESATTLLRWQQIGKY